MKLIFDPDHENKWSRSWDHDPRDQIAKDQMIHDLPTVLQPQRIKILVCCLNFMYYFFWGALPLKSSQVWFFANITLLPAHQMTKFCIYSKRPPPVSSKKRFQSPRIEILLSLTILYFFSLGGCPPPPGKSSSSVFCQYFPYVLSKK